MGSCAAPSAKGDDKFITTDYLQQCRFLIAAVELLTEAVNILVLQVFRKDDYAVKYAVEPLLDGSGPLGDLSVRLKLMEGANKSLI